MDSNMAPIMSSVFEKYPLAVHILPYQSLRAAYIYEPWATTAHLAIADRLDEAEKIAIYFQGLMLHSEYLSSHWRACFPFDAKLPENGCWVQYFPTLRPKEQLYGG